ncbi:MAG: DUF5666 domain-containing protein [Betaproteobacteria bacterium]
MANRWRCMVGWMAVTIVTGAGAQPALERIHADVVVVAGDTLQVRTAAGQMTSIRLADKTRVQSRAAADSSRLAPGLYVGVTAVPQPDGTLLASQINVFPESLRGTGEGHRPMETLPGSTMTNATVGAVAATPQSTTTNATVAQAAGSDRSRRLTLTYAGGEKLVIVPGSTPVILTEIGDRSLLVPGAHVVVYASRQVDGSLASERVSVGKNGTVPAS